MLYVIKAFAEESFGSPGIPQAFFAGICVNQPTFSEPASQTVFNSHRDLSIRRPSGACSYLKNKKIPGIENSAKHNHSFVYGLSVM